MKNIALLMLAAAIGLTVMAPRDAEAFCGFYIGGGGAELFNDASQVVLMRSGTKTILSMQNRYEGPVENFAMVIPVPQVLMQANVKTLEESVFAKVDQLSAPRLVEYYEEDPCGYRNEYGTNNGLSGSFDAGQSTTNNGVVVEAEFKVGEYDIVVLSSTESTSLETWLTDNGYNLPAGAAPYYQPYIDAGMYFFVAKVDPAKVTFDGMRAVLSPLRFDYDSSDFFLPVRLGMLNSQGTQDIIINILGRDTRFELANYPNATIPTNLEVTADTKNNFGDFYRALFARTVKENPGAVITEYAWASSTCDPCPGPTLDASDLLTLGADVIGQDAEFSVDWVITRLHARYDKDEIGEDLIFKTASPIAGGREFLQENGKLEEGSRPWAVNNFQGRYIIRHPWKGAIDCEDPVIGNWGYGAASGTAQSPTNTGASIAVPDNVDLEQQLVDDAPEIGLTGQGSREAGSTPGGGNNGTGTNNNGAGTNNNGTSNGAADAGGLGSKEVGGGGCSTAPGLLPSSLFMLLALALGTRLRRRRGA